MFLNFAKYFCTKVPSKVNKMVRILNVAEKNDAAKSLAEIMSRGGYRRKDGYSKFNKIYEWEYSLPQYRNCSMTMTSVSGHLLNFEFATQYQKWYSCDPVMLFDAPVLKFCPDNYKDIKRTLEREIKGCAALIIWTDCDREGENIGFEIIQVCQAVKPNIRIYRARFSEITHQAVNRAINNLLEPDKNTSDAVDVRSELDLRIGAAFTRFQTLRLKKVFPDVLADQLISYGSCQFPTLGFVVERYKQVQQFVPEPFWKIHVTHETEDGAVEFNWKRVRLFDHTACLVLYQHCLEDPIAEVVDVKKKPKSKWRPAALDTVELEKLASRKLRITAKETMKIAEKLYTQGFISYPRTETNIFPKELDLASLVQQQTQDHNWGAFAGQLLQNGITPRNGNKTDQAHPPIHPIKYTNNLQGNEQKVYEFIVRHFLACCSRDAQGEETVVEIDINKERFTAQGLMIIARNYLDVYPYDKWNAKIIPVFHQGETFQPKSIEMNQGETSPPQLLTEADLISLMDKHGIGTDATHAEHIETIKSRLYVGVRNDGRFLPGELGMGLVEGYDSMGYEMSKPHLRSELELGLTMICQGNRNKDEVLKEQIRKYKEVFIEAVKQARKIDVALSEYFGNAQTFLPDAQSFPSPKPVKPCPLCNSQMVLRTKKDGKYFVSCMGYPSCRNAVWFPDGVQEAAVQEETCHQCAGQVNKIKFKFRKGSVPPYIPTEYVGCIGGCDETLREVLNIRDTAPVRSTPNAGSAQGGNRSQNQSAGNDSGYGSSFQSTQSRSISTQSNTGTGRQRAPLAPVAPCNNQPGMLGNTRPPGPAGGPTGGAGGDIVCTCGENAKLLTVRKEGPNTGRQFYACSKPQGSGCGFFLWADENADQNQGSNGRGGGGGGFQPSQNARLGGGFGGYDDDSGGGGGSVVCGCGQPAKSLTVQKEGANKGRQFYTCPKPRGEGCNFFQWADDSGGAAGGSGFTGQNPRASGTSGGSFGGSFQSPSSSSRFQSGGGFDDRNGGDAVVCGCGQPAKSLTVHKEGANKGRQFYACMKPRDESCNFFQWADESGGGSYSGGGGSGRGSGRGRGVTESQPKKPGGKRKCGVCGEIGHNKRNCPHNAYP